MDDLVQYIKTLNEGAGDETYHAEMYMDVRCSLVYTHLRVYKINHQEKSAQKLVLDGAGASLQEAFIDMTKHEEVQERLCYGSSN